MRTYIKRNRGSERIRDDEIGARSVQRCSLSCEEGVWCIPARIRPLRSSPPPPLLLFSSLLIHPPESCSSPSVRCYAHSSSRTVSILWRRTEEAGRRHSQALNGRHLDGNPRVKPGETGRALCCDVIRCMLTIRKVCTINRLKQRLQRGLSPYVLVTRLTFFFILLTFCASGRWLNKGLLLLSVMWSFYQR